MVYRRRVSRSCPYQGVDDNVPGQVGCSENAALVVRSEQEILPITCPLNEARVMDQDGAREFQRIREGSKDSQGKGKQAKQQRDTSGRDHGSMSSEQQLAYGGHLCNLHLSTRLLIAAHRTMWATRCYPSGTIWTA